MAMHLHAYIPLSESEAVRLLLSLSYTSPPNVSLRSQCIAWLLTVIIVYHFVVTVEQNSSCMYVNTRSTAALSLKSVSLS